MQSPHREKEVRTGPDRSLYCTGVQYVGRTLVNAAPAHHVARVPLRRPASSGGGQRERLDVARDVRRGTRQLHERDVRVELCASDQIGSSRTRALLSLGYCTHFVTGATGEMGID